MMNEEGQAERNREQAQGTEAKRMMWQWRGRVPLCLVCLTSVLCCGEEIGRRAEEQEGQRRAVLIRCLLCMSECPVR